MGQVWELRKHRAQIQDRRRWKGRYFLTAKTHIRREREIIVLISVGREK